MSSCSCSRSPSAASPSGSPSGSSPVPSSPTPRLKLFAISALQSLCYDVVTATRSLCNRNSPGPEELRTTVGVCHRQKCPHVAGDYFFPRHTGTQASLRQKLLPGLPHLLAPYMLPGQPPPKRHALPCSWPVHPGFPDEHTATCLWKTHREPPHPLWGLQELKDPKGNATVIPRPRAFLAPAAPFRACRPCVGRLARPQQVIIT